MRMFQSVLGHSGEQSIARYSSRQSVSQLRVSPTLFQTDLRITNHSGQISTVTNVPFIQNSNRMASKLTATASFPSVFFQHLQFSRQCPSFSAHRDAPMTKSDLTFPVSSSKFVDFAVSTNEIASSCIDNRLRQMAFFVFTKEGGGRLSGYIERF